MYYQKHTNIHFIGAQKIVFTELMVENFLQGNRHPETGSTEGP